MPKGYWIAHVDVKDTDAYKNYIEANAVPFKKFNASFLVRSGTYECVEGQTRSRNVIIEFPSYQDAQDCYHSEEYRAAKALRDGAAEADITIIEGV
ncbi:MAG: DUF1330 domain-containing protein [Methyloligellaceae bacterium]